MRIEMDKIGSMIFVGEEDDPRGNSVLGVEITDNDELLISLRGDDVEINAYVSIQLWKALYEMAFKEADQRVYYTIYNKS